MNILSLVPFTREPESDNYKGSLPLSCFIYKALAPFFSEMDIVTWHCEVKQISNFSLFVCFQMNKKEYRRRLSQTGWTHTSDRWVISLYPYLKLPPLVKNVFMQDQGWCMLLEIKQNLLFNAHAIKL